MPILCNFSDVECCGNPDSQFQLKKIKLADESPRKFYRSSLFPSQLLYCVYRGLLAAYFIAWFIAQVITKQLAGENPKHFIYLTTWAETTLNLHLIASFLTCLYGYIYEFGDDSEKSTPTSSEVNLGGESAKVLIPTRSTSSGELRWFHKLSWVLYSFAIDVGMAVTIAFWALLRTEFDAFSWHCHLINSVAILLDLIVADTPIRLLHFSWTIIWGLIYISFTYLMYKETIYKFIYEGVLDWGNWPLVTCAVVFGVCFVIVPFAHSMAFLIHRLKLKMLRRINYFKLYSSDEVLPTMSEKVPFDGFKPGQKIVTYESDKFDTKANQKARLKRVEELKESKRTRRRTNSGCYAKLDNLPDSDM